MKRFFHISLTLALSTATPAFAEGETRTFQRFNVTSTPEMRSAERFLAPAFTPQNGPAYIATPFGGIDVAEDPVTVSRGPARGPVLGDLWFAFGFVALLGAAVALGGRIRW